MLVTRALQEHTVIGSRLTVFGPTRYKVTPCGDGLPAEARPGRGAYRQRTKGGRTGHAEWLQHYNIPPPITTRRGRKL